MCFKILSHGYRSIAASYNLIENPSVAFRFCSSSIILDVLIMYISKGFKVNCSWNTRISSIKLYEILYHDGDINRLCHTVYTVELSLDLLYHYGQFCKSLRRTAFWEVGFLYDQCDEIAR